jgi:putative membrane protein
VIKIVVNALALAAAAGVVGGIHLAGGFWEVLGVAVVFSIVNTLVRPILAFFSLPFIILTLGLFLVVVNAAMLELTDALTDSLVVDGFGSAILGALVISLVSLIVGGVLKDEKRKS